MVGDSTPQLGRQPIWAFGLAFRHLGQGLLDLPRMHTPLTMVRQSHASSVIEPWLNVSGIYGFTIVEVTPMLIPPAMDLLTIPENATVGRPKPREGRRGGRRQALD
eukprot:13799606-Alexandrium_andersonii.AAC.1